MMMMMMRVYWNTHTIPIFYFLLLLFSLKYLFLIRCQSNAISSINTITLYRVTDVRLFERFKAEGEIVPMQAMKAEGGMEIVLHHDETTTLDGGEWPTFNTGRCIAVLKAPSSPWIGDGVGPRAGLDALA